MKNHRNILLTIITLVSTQFTQSAERFFNVTPTIEIYNKIKNDIYVVINDISTNYLIENITIRPNEQWKNSAEHAIDKNSKLKIKIVSDQKTKTFTINAPGKTKYLSWDPAKSPSLYPQTGTLFGLLGKTKSGLSLKNNVSSSEIKEIHG